MRVKIYHLLKILSRFIFKKQKLHVNNFFNLKLNNLFDEKKAMNELKHVIINYNIRN